MREQMITLLKEYQDCFAWDYTEMPGLDRNIVEHWLPLKKGFRPFQQPARQMKAEVLEEVKKEVQKMLDAGFIRPCRYEEWISSVVPIQKKDGRWRCSVEVSEIHADSPSAILLLYRDHAGDPFCIPTCPDEPCIKHLLHLFLNLL